MEEISALGLTLACEVPMLLVLARRHSGRAVFMAAVGASLLTHPLAWQAAAKLGPDQYVAGVVVIEAVVVVVEATWYQFWLRPGPGRALVWSLAANGLSALTGIAMPA